jgi:hypothetical protein
MCESNYPKFLFRCQECELIVAIDFDLEEDIIKVNNNDMIIDCPCGSFCLVLRN